MPGYSTSVISHPFDHPDAVRERARLWRERDEARRAAAAIDVPLWRDAVCYHEASHCVVRTALGGHVESVKLLPNGDGVTRGTTRHDDGLDVIASMIALAAGKAGQRRFGAQASLFTMVGLRMTSGR